MMITVVNAGPPSDYNERSWWKGRCDAQDWPPPINDLMAALYAWRARQLIWLRSDPNRLRSARLYYKTRPGELINHLGRAAALRASRHPVTGY
jgi:hypothetical protein